MLDTFAAPLATQLAVVPILVGPLQVLLAMLPAILLGLGSAVLALFKPSTFKLALRLLWRLKLSVLVLAVVLAGSLSAWRSVRRRSPGASANADLAARDWPMFRGGLQRSGTVEGSAAPASGGINWSFASEAKTFHASPAIVGNRVYVTSAEVGVFSTRGAIYCLDADSGAVVWKNAPPGFRATFSSPSVSGKYLVTGEGLHQTEDGRVSCLDVTRGGSLLWSYRTKSHVESSAAIADGRAYIGAGDDGYYCFALEPDPRGSPVVLWHLEGKKYPDAESAPIAHDGRVYFGLGLNGQAVVCVDGKTGRELWRVPTPFPVFAPLCITRGKLMVGMGRGDFVKSAEEINAGPDGEGPLRGEVWCIDLPTQRVEWRFETDRTVLGAIVAGEDHIFFASRAGTVYSVGFDGKPIAQWNAHAPILASPAFVASHLYVVAESGRLFALEQGSLQPVWETSLGAGGICLSSPGIARGHVYVGSPSNGVLCLGTPANAGKDFVWLGNRAGAGGAASSDGSALPASGAVQWRWPDSDSAEQWVITAPAAVSRGQVFIGAAEGPRRGLLCLGADDGRERWNRTTDNREFSSHAPERFVSFVEWSEHGPPRVHLVDAKAGWTKWSAEAPAAAPDATSVAWDGLFLQDSSGEFASYYLSGPQRWRTTLVSPAAGSGAPRLAGPAARVESLVFVATEQPAALFAIDALEGGKLWGSELSDAPLTGPVVHGNIVLFGTATGIAAHRIIDGKPLWNAAVGEVRTALAVGSDLVCAINTAHELVLLDNRSGEVRARTPGALPHIPPLLTRAAILYATAEGVMRCELATNASKLWLSTRDLGALTSPMILVNSAVYFATERGGFIRAGGQPVSAQ